MSSPKLCKVCNNYHKEERGFVAGRKYIALTNYRLELVENIAYECLGKHPDPLSHMFVRFKIETPREGSGHVHTENGYACSILFALFDPDKFECNELTKAEKIQLAIESCRMYGVTNEEELKRFLGE